MSETTPDTRTEIPEADVVAFIAKYGNPYDPATDDYRRPPFAAPMKAGKNSSIYNAHSYHTKVPPLGIIPYIEHYTDTGALVLDPFCGSGMTGVAALMSGRHALLSDLSPAAAHIALNYCSPIDGDKLRQALTDIQRAVQEEIEWLYGTECERCGGPATIQSTIWSDVFECGRCGEEIILWDAAVDNESEKIREVFTCPRCEKQQVKKGLRRLGRTPVITSHQCKHCRPARSKHATTELEKQRITQIDAQPIPYWYPKDEFPLGRQTRKLRQGTAGISQVDQLFTHRNLWALARYWSETEKIPDRTVAARLRFALTAIMGVGSRRNRWPQQQTISGTLYVPSLSMEMNIAEQFVRRMALVIEAAESLVGSSTDALVTVNSATRLRISDSTVDYIFTDPPFGSNLQYAELNFVWEAWLRQVTEWSDDCVMNYVHGKDLDFYAQVMTQAFVEMYHVLKPGRWASVVFHNTDDAVWQAIQVGAQMAGFEVVNAMAFDKRQGTFNQVNMGKDQAAGFDVVLNLFKPRGLVTNGKAVSATDTETEIAAAVVQHLSTTPSSEHRTSQFIHSYVIRHFIGANLLIEKVTIPNLEAILPHYFKQVDGRWYLRGEQIVGQSAFIVRTETDVITWLRAILSAGPQTTGELIPQWHIATLDAHVHKTLDQILTENFWQDFRTGKWRMPNAVEREKMSAQHDIADKARMRQIRRYLDGERDAQPDHAELCGWVHFAYEHKMFEEAARLFANVHAPDVDEELYRKTRKVAQFCRMQADKSRDDNQLPLL